MIWELNILIPVQSLLLVPHFTLSFSAVLPYTLAIHLAPPFCTQFMPCSHFSSHSDMVWLLTVGTGSGSAAASSGSSPRRTHKSRSQTASPRGESQKILRHLVTPPVGHRAASFDEFLHLRTQNPKCSVVSSCCCSWCIANFGHWFCISDFAVLIFHLLLHCLALLPLCL